MQHSAHLQLPLGSPDLSRVVMAAIDLEVQAGPEGSRCVVAQEGEILDVRLEATDLATLRAALNSIVRLATAAQQVALAGGP